VQQVLPLLVQQVQSVQLAQQACPPKRR